MSRISSMKIAYLTLTGILFLATTSRADLTVYNDKSPALTNEWANNVNSTSEVTCPVPFEGTKCMDYNFTLKGYYFQAVTESPLFLPQKQMDASSYKYFQFAARIVPALTNADTIQFWCIHCDPNKANTDLTSNGKAAFQPTSTWQVFSIPMSIFSGDHINVISAIVFNFGGGTGSGDFYLDDVKFTNNLPTTAIQVTAPSLKSLEIPVGASLKVDIYSLKGDLVASRTLRDATSSAQATSQVARSLRAGTYVVRQSLLNGSTVSRLDADRMLVVAK